MKRLAKVEALVERKKKAEAKRYNKAYPGEMIHFDTKRLPLLKGETKNKPREYMFVAIDDFSRELYVGILPDKTQDSAALFLRQVIDECPYTIESAYSDNGKAKRVIKTLMDMWHEKYIFDSRQDRQIALSRFVNFYNTVKPHTGIGNLTPYELLINYFEL